MPLFFFDVDDGDEHNGDRYGVELTDVLEATREAATLAGELLRDRPDHFWNTRDWKLTVEDSGGLVLFTIVMVAHVAPAAAAAIPRRQRQAWGPRRQI